MRKSPSLVVALVSLLAGCFVMTLTGCNGIEPNAGAGNGSGGGGGNGSGGGNGGGTGGGTGGTSSSTGGTTGYQEPTCGQQTFNIGLSQQEPNVLLVVDKSGSMQDPIPGTTDTKWDTAKKAIFSLLMTYTGKVRWGLSVFPRIGGDKCDAGDLQIPFGPDRSQVIINLLTPITSAMIGGSTPTETTLQNLQLTAGLNDTARNNYILLLTDGLPTCSQDGKVTPVVAALYAQSPSVRTFVVGLGADTDSNPAQLDEWAVAGHTDRAGAMHKYYQANNINDLDMAFAEIASGIASCTYQLSMAPDDPSLIVVTVDGSPVVMDATNGFTYDAGSQSMTFHGAVCDAVKNGTAKQVDLVYGCPPPPVK
jgi:von Willebrand factor type A domain